MSKSVYLSPSTQWDNIGAGCFGSERDRMNQIANVVSYVLNKHGVTVYRNNPDMSLEQIVDDSNSKNPDVHFAIHSNAGGARGCEVFCFQGGAEGEGLAWQIYNNLSPITPTKDRGVKEGANFYGAGIHMYEVYGTNAPAALVETAFHDNWDDANWIVNNIEPIGIALAKGVLSYLGISYIDPAPTQPTTQATTTQANNNDIYYRVMSGSYGIRANAEKKANDLKNAGFEAVIMPFSPLYRVMTGSYKSRDNANKQIERLNNAGFDAMIIPSN